MKKAAALLLLLTAIFIPACNQSYERKFFAMDTYMSFTVYGDDDSLYDAEMLVKELDLAFSVTNKDGEIFLLNSSGYLASPSGELLEMLECARILNERTGGAYDITSRALTVLWAACEDEDRLPTEQEISAALELIGMEKLSLVDGIALNGVYGIDLGSIAKGYAGREAAKMLADSSDGGILSLGGNVVTFGEKLDGSLFKVGITDPGDPQNVCGFVTVGATSVVTSGKYHRSFEIGGVKYNHIINAKTGYPCENGIASVTVICDDGMWADGLSTALLLLGEQGALDYYRTYGGFEAVIIMDDGRIVTTSDAVVFTRV